MRCHVPVLKPILNQAWLQEVGTQTPYHDDIPKHIPAWRPCNNLCVIGTTACYLHQTELSHARP